MIARKGVTRTDRALLDDIAKQGVTITELDQAGHDAFVKTTQPVYDKWKTQIGASLVDKAEKAIAARKPDAK